MGCEGRAIRYTPEQVAMAKCVKRALEKAQKVGLGLYVYSEVGVFLASEAGAADGRRQPGQTMADWALECAMDVEPTNLLFDGGTGI